MDGVSFIHTELGDDLIVSFALSRPDDLTGVASLTLIRTPKYEMFLYDWERGTSVSFEEDEDNDDETVLLTEVDYNSEEKTLTIRSTKTEYLLDVRKVDPKELKDMRRVLRKMNFDSSISLKGL